MRRLEAELVKDLTPTPLGFRPTQQAIIPPWVGGRLKYFAQQLKAGNLTNHAALAEQLLLLGESPVPTSEGMSWADESEIPYPTEQLEVLTETDMDCAEQQAPPQWSVAPGNRRRLLGKHMVETPQLGAPGSAASPASPTNA